MVKDQPWPEGGKALVAVNLSSEEPYHDPLNIKLVQETVELAQNVNQTEVHLVGAYPVTRSTSPSSCPISIRASTTTPSAASI